MDTLAPSNSEQQDVQQQTPPQQPGLFTRILRHRYLEHYNRLFFLVAVVNIGYLVFGLNEGQWWNGEGIAISSLANMVLANFALAVIIRQQYVVNALFWLATRAPTSWPLSIRWTLGKVYHFGGLHSSGATFGTLWYGAFVAALVYHANNNLAGVPEGVLFVTYALFALLVGIVFMATPPVRGRFHDLFELSHRFGGWSVLALFWVQTILFAKAGFADAGKGELSLVEALVSDAGFWLLSAMTFSVILPWLRLKKVKVDIASPSNHVALVGFDHGVTPFPGSSTPVSRSPLTEWHSFANVPAPGKDGFRLTISRAGDWTGQFIDDKPSEVWVRGIPTAGVANIEVLFKRVVYVATGSGIGPCLPHLLANEVPSCLVWSTRNPRKTYGDELVDEILESSPDAVVWDTSAQGKPDLVKLALEAYHRFDAEAVICIANQPLTQKVVYEMECMGIPAYGAIWDS